MTHPDPPPPPPRDERPWHIVVFGATGFAGRLVALYLDRHAPPGVRIAIAGRNRDKLAAVRADLARADVGEFIASVDDPASLAAMAAAARVVVTTVGPYARHGEPVVAACVAAGTDYVDLTGEPPFVERTIAAYDEQARERGALIVHACGFDSIPTDLGVLYTVHHLPPGRPITIEGDFAGRGGYSGGTFASALGVMSAPRRRRAPRPAPPSDARVVKRIRERVHFERRLRRWAIPLPTLDPVIALRSARARPDYGPEFRYGHYLTLKSLPQVAGAFAGVAALAVLARVGPARRLLERARPSGTGPDEATRKKSWFKFTFVGRAGDAEVVTEVAGGDPGYDETAKMCGEAALCLALQRAELPHAGGVRTTAEALGEPLLARLQAAGLSFRVVERRGA